MRNIIKFFTIITITGMILISCEAPVETEGTNPETNITDAQLGKKATVGSNAKSLGKVTVGADVQDDGAGEMLYGSGIPNGEWVVAETQGVQLGARITDRKDGTLDVSGDKGNRVGVYEASTGFDGTDTDRAEWNYEWSVDISNAKGNAKGKTLEDYTLTLEQDFTEENLFGVLGNDPVTIPLNSGVGYVFNNGTLFQQSWNPVFGNDDFDFDEEGTYNFRFVLTPKTFNGPPLAVKVKVVVSD